MKVNEWVTDESNKEGFSKTEIKEIVNAVNIKVGKANQQLFTEGDYRCLVRKIKDSSSGLQKQGFNLDEVADYCIGLVYQKRLGSLTGEEIVEMMIVDYNDGRI